MLKLADLAARADFDAGPLHVSPARRLIEGPAGSTHVEPIVMKVFLLLLDAGGGVVTRDELFGHAWGGVFVGDDSLNRAIAQVRKIASEAAPGLFEIETIPRTGYRLTGPIVESLDERAVQEVVAAPISRRRLIGAGIGAVAAAGGAGLWWAARERSNARFDALMARGEKAMRKGDWSPQTAAIFKQAVSIRPDSARAWGLLALLNTGLAQAVRAKEAPRIVEEAENAARRALAIDPKEPNALLAMFELQGSTLDWATRDQKLRQIIAIDPKNLVAIGELILLLQAAGLNRESWNWNERALTIEPLSADFLSKRALKLWIAGRVSEADKVIDQVRTLYPGDTGPWWVRFGILALTGRPRAAQAMLDPDPARLGSPEDIKLWRAALAALDQRSPESIARASDACFEAAKIPGGSAGEAVMILSALGQVDSAFDVVNGFLLSRGSLVRGDQPESKQVFNDAVSRINTQWLFTPPCVLMRADARFLPLCEAMGLGEYWRARGVRPDYQLTER
jgi:DNA-binding winged helix-turn-helix (wHTH) protein/tetratricopeptide (TPR) repeat protein